DGTSGNLEALWDHIARRAADLEQRGTTHGLATTVGPTGTTASDGLSRVSPAWWIRQRARLGAIAARLPRVGRRQICSLGLSGSGKSWLVAAGLSPSMQKSPPISGVAAILEIIGELSRAGQPDALATSRCAAFEAVVEAAERDPARAAPEL